MSGDQESSPGWHQPSSIMDLGSWAVSTRCRFAKNEISFCQEFDILQAAWSRNTLFISLTHSHTLFRQYVVYSWSIVYLLALHLLYCIAPMDTTEQVLSRRDSTGVAVSPPSNIPSCPHLFTLGTRCLQYALTHLRLGRVRHPWSMSVSFVKVGLNVHSSTLGLGLLH